MAAQTSGKMRVLVTGAQGNVGREVVQACIEAGFTVRATGRDAERVRARFPDCEAARFDFLDRSTWAAALEGVNYAFLLRPPAISDVKTTINAFSDAARQAGVEHQIFVSVAGAQRRAWVPHRKVELHLEATGNDWTVLRPGFFAQNFQDAYLRDIVEEGRIYVPAGEGRVAFIDVRDVGAVAARIFAEPEGFRAQALTLTGPEALTFFEAARQLSSAIGRPVRYQPASVVGYAWHLRRRRGLAWPHVVVQTVLHVGLRRGDAEAVDRTVEEVLGRPAGALGAYFGRSADIWRSSVAPSPG